MPPDSGGAALLYFTGSQEHNVRLRGHALKKKLLLNEYGLYRVGAEARGQEIASRSEEEVYAALGMDWMAPELLEDHGEIDAALAHALPSLLTVADIRATSTPTRIGPTAATRSRPWPGAPATRATRTWPSRTTRLGSVLRSV